MSCIKCDDLGEIEVVEGYFSFCSCDKGIIKKYADLESQRLKLKQELKDINSQMKLLKIKIGRLL